MKAAIFDMDGVIFPTEHFKFQAYKKVFKDVYGVDLRDTKARLGLSEPAAMKLFLEASGKGQDIGRIAELIQLKREAYYLILEQEEFQPIPGVKEFFKVLEADGGFKTGLATVSNKKSTEILLERFDLKKFFDSILSIEHVTRPKPDPEIYLLSAKHLGIDPEDCIVFEDSLAGLEAAKEAGMHRIGVATSIASEKLKPKSDLVISSFQNIGLEDIKDLFCGIS